MSEFIFIDVADPYFGDTKPVYVIKSEDLRELKFNEIREFGQLIDWDFESDKNWTLDMHEEAGEKFYGYGIEYWDGQVWQTVVFKSEYADSQAYSIDDLKIYSIIEDKERIPKYNELIRKYNSGYPCDESRTGFKSCVIEGYLITQSFWEMDWELYSIQVLDKSK